MTRRERVMATLRGEPVDRPPLNFYEINGLDEDWSNPDPFNVFNDPSWRPLIELARDRTDRIVRRGVPLRDAPPDPTAELWTHESWLDEQGYRHTVRTLRAGDRVLTTRSVRDPDVDTTWCTEPLLKGVDDLRAWLALPEREVGGEPDVSAFLAAEEAVGDTGIVMVDTGDALCSAAPLFEMGEYTVVAMTEPALFHQAMERFQRHALYWTEQVARALPGRLWRICGPEYASPPYLPPRLFKEYVTAYDTPLVELVQRWGGVARIHSHGRLREVLDLIAATGCTGLDPIEPPPQGDVELAYVRERYGRQMVLFGNIECSEIETLEPATFRRRVEQALREGTMGEGRGFVLQPSACPAGRKLAARSLRNYEIMVEAVEAFSL